MLNRTSEYWESKEDELIDSLESLLNKEDWDIWATITFRSPISRKNAQKRFKTFFRNLNTKYEKFYDKLITAWVFIEDGVFPTGDGDATEGIHIHAIIKGIDPALSYILEEKSYAYFGNSRITPFHDGVAHYLAKKYCSDKLVDIDYLRINSKFRK